MEDYAEGKNATPLPPGLHRFDWDTKIADIVPKKLGWSLQDLNGDDWASRDVSVADALGHASGLPRHDFSYRPGDTPEDVVRRMGLLRTAYELRQKWSYNNQVTTRHMFNNEVLMTDSGHADVYGGCIFGLCAHRESVCKVCARTHI